MIPDIDSFDLDAAILRKNEQDLQAFLSALATRLTQAFPTRVSVDRRRNGVFSSNRRIVRIELSLDDAAFTISLDRSGIQTTRAKVVRGVAISTTMVPPGTWMEDVREAVRMLADTSDEASAVIGKFL